MSVAMMIRASVCVCVLLAILLAGNEREREEKNHLAHTEFGSFF